MVRNFFGSISTVYVSTPTTDLQAANKAYVDSKSSGDMSFLMKKTFNSEIVSNEGLIETTGDLATLTASSGKDMYLAAAKISYGVEEAAAATHKLGVELKINGVIVESFVNLFDSDGSTQGTMGNNYQFINIGQKVEATEIIKLEVITNGGNLYDIEGTIVCVEIDTGVDPTTWL